MGDLTVYSSLAFLYKGTETNSHYTGLRSLYRQTTNKTLINNY